MILFLEKDKVRENRIRKKKETDWKNGGLYWLMLGADDLKLREKVTRNEKFR